MLRQRSNVIEKKAEEILRQANALTVPVDPSKVAEKLGVKVHYQNLESQVSGVLIIKSDEKHIMVNKDHHPNRQRFSIAHELGHLCLHVDQGDRLFIDTHLRVYQRAGAPSALTYKEPGSTTTPEEEREANIFASALLMPAVLVQHAALTRDLWDELDVTALAQSFGVSEQAMSIRLQQLGVLDAVLIRELA